MGSAATKMPKKMGAGMGMKAQSMGSLPSMGAGFGDGFKKGGLVKKKKK